MTKTTMICYTVCYVAACALAGFLCWCFKTPWGVLALLLAPKITD